MNNSFLPISKEDMKARGWDSLDIIIVTGDAYVDHPSYAAAVIGRVLESEGFRVGIIAQPNWHKTDDFKKLGRPRLFFGVTAGNLDSMVANYTASHKFRSVDDYSPGGKKGLRPDRATMIYANKLRQAFGEIAIVIGGIEASLRRLAHYDYWSDKVRRSILLDSKADILVYGMGEKQILEIARRMQNGKDAKDLGGIRGTVVVRNSIDGLKDAVVIPSFEEVNSDKNKFNQAFRATYLEQDPFRGKTIVQKHAARYVIQFPSALPLATEEIDRIYELKYALRPHSVYDKEGGVPGFEAVRSSVISHRGCPGECSYCSLGLHQGRIVQSRSGESILREIKALARRKDFKGTVTDIGGPTANLYMARCRLWGKDGSCRDRKCLVPEKCKNLELGYRQTLDLWREAGTIPGVKNIFIGSGVRYDLLVGKESDELLKDLCAYHVSGRLKVAPEHSEAKVLGLMNKPSFNVYREFVKRYSDMNKKLRKKQYLVNYFITGHPGSTLEDALKLALTLAEMKIYPEQIQDFIPLPMTPSGCMYYTEKDPFTGKAVYVAKGMRDRKLQRALVQFKQPQNKRYVIEALRSLDKMNFMNVFYG